MSINRREFLSQAATASSVVSLSSTVPGFLVEAAAADADSREETVLVVVQLSGGNDGLNTVIPYANDNYRRNRPTLAVAESDVLKIDEQLGFHPSLRGFADLLEAGQLSIIQGVGYDNPNRSHFESMDIWHTCQRKDEQRVDGWLGRYLESAAHMGKVMIEVGS